MAPFRLRDRDDWPEQGWFTLHPPPQYPPPTATLDAVIPQGTYVVIEVVDGDRRWRYSVDCEREAATTRKLRCYLGSTLSEFEAQLLDTSD